MSRNRRPNRRRKGTWFRRCLLVGAVALLLRTWCLEGLLVPCRIVGGSMADTLRGAHRCLTCDDCGHRFACDAEVRPLGPRATCPNCDFAGNNLEARLDLSGDRVLVQKSAFAFRSPRRWEIVVLRMPHCSEQIAVKRVVGLPGERIELRGGDVIVGGQAQRKSYAEQRAMAVLVHDANCEPHGPNAPPPRWRGAGRQTRWGADRGQFVRPATSVEEAADWLTYTHVRRTTADGGFRETPITDDCGYNQTLPRRVEDIHRVPDVMLSLRLLSLEGNGQLTVRAGDGRDTFAVRLRPALGRFEVDHNGRPLPDAEGPYAIGRAGLVIEASLMDRQFMLALDGTPVVTWPYEPADGPTAPPSQPLAIGAQGVGVALCDLRVYRDVYYARPIGVASGRGMDGPLELGDDEYYLVGDNSPVSIDSRNWPAPPGVPAKLLLGKPLLILSAWQEASLLGRSFQVPDPARIRYIR